MKSIKNKLEQKNIISVRNLSRGFFLSDGTSLLIRAIRPDDKQRLLDGLHHLSNKSVYYRFFRSKHELTEKELKYFTEVDFNHHVAIVAAIQNVGKENDIGVARYIELKDRGSQRIAEVAFAIDDEYQHKGVGTLLFKELVAIAQEQGIKRLVAEVLLDNKAMLKIFEHSGYKLETTISNGVATIKFNIAR